MNSFFFLRQHLLSIVSGEGPAETSYVQAELFHRTRHVPLLFQLFEPIRMLLAHTLKAQTLIYGLCAVIAR